MSLIGLSSPPLTCSVDQSTGVDIELSGRTLRYTFRARVTDTISFNRLGLCLLLPGTLAGNDITTFRTNGSHSVMALPQYIAPHQPCTDLSRIDLASDAGEVSSSGELPLLGVRVNGFDGYCEVTGAPSDVPADYYRVDTVDDRAGIDLRRLTIPTPAHVYLPAADFRCDLPIDTSQSNARLAIIDPQDATILPLGNHPGLIGTDGAFAELNRSRPAVPPGSIATFTISPEVHDFDDETVVDNLFGIGLLELTPHFNPAFGDMSRNAPMRRSWKSR